MQRFTRKNRRNLTKKTHPGTITIGLIYANWCGHCQALKPEWKKMKHNVMKTLSYKKGIYKFVEIEDADKTKEQQIAVMNSGLHGSKIEANGYPTIFKIHGGKVKYFEGDRTSGELQNWFLGENQPENKKPPMQPQPGFIGFMRNRIFGGKTRRKRRS
jgi:thiol-disulfide isomerase/thioredoxin